MRSELASQTRTAEADRQRTSAVFVHPQMSPSAPVHPIFRLQQTIGNRAVQRLLQSQTIQPKLAISQPGDVYEQEADRVAEQVMRMPEPVIQRTCSACGGGSSCAKCELEKAPLVQRKTEQGSDSSASVSDQFLHDLGLGEPLDAATRAFFEPRFRHEFGSVRVHSYAAAQQSAQEVSANAYTFGNDIVFAAGRYAPTTGEGRRLIAHELTHVVQQSNAHGNSVSQRSDGTALSPVSIPQPQPVVNATIQRKERSPGNPPRQGRVKSKPLRQTASNRVAFMIHFDKPLTRSEFIDLAEMTIYGRLTPGEWKGVPDQFKASDSPVQVIVPASTLEPGLRTNIAALPPHIQSFLLTNKSVLGSYEDLQSVANAGFILAAAGVTEDELELSLLELSEEEASDLVSWAVTLVERRDQEVHKVSETAAEEERQEKFREKIEHLTPDALRTEAAEVVAALGAPMLSDSRRRALESNLNIIEDYASAQGFDLPEATAYRLRQVTMALTMDLGTLSKQLKEILRTKVGDQTVGEEKGLFSSEFQPGAIWALEQLSWATDALSDASGLTAAAEAGGAKSEEQFRAAGARVTAVLFTSQAVAIHLAYLHVAVVAASDFGNPFVNQKIASKVSIVREELEPLLQELRSLDPSRVDRAVKELRSPSHGFQADFESFVEDLQEHAHTMKRVRQVANIVSLVMMGRGLMARPGGGPPITGGPGIGGMTAGSVAVARGAIGSVEWLEAMRQLVAIGAISTAAAVGRIGGGTAGALPMPAKPTLTAASQGKPPGDTPDAPQPVSPGPAHRVHPHVLPRPTPPPPAPQPASPGPAHRVHPHVIPRPAAPPPAPEPVPPRQPVPAPEPMPPRHSVPAPQPAPPPPAVPSRRAALEGKPDWNKLPVPEGYRRPDGTIEIDRFGRDVIQWGTGPEEARKLVEMMNAWTAWRRRRAYLTDLKSRGVTPEMARAWAKEYQLFANNERRNSTAPWRAELLRRIAELL